MAPRHKSNGKQQRGDAPLRRPMTEMMDRQPPFDLQAECGVLGSVMLLPKLFDDVSQIIHDDDFYDDANRGIYAHIADLHKAGRPIDDTLLVNSLKAGGDWEAIGGAAYLQKVLHAVPNAAHAIYYAEIVREKAVYRSLIYSATEILRDAYDESEPAADLLTQAEGKFRKISDRGLGMEEPVLLGDAADAVCKRFENPEAQSINLLYFGLETPDERIGPIMGGEVAVIAARPGNGKTAFAMQILRNAAQHGNPAMFVSLEMTGRELATRELGRIAEIDSRTIRSNALTPEETQGMRRAQQQVGDLPLWVWSPAAAKIGDIRATVRKAVQRRGIRAIAIDYLSLIEIDKEDRKLPRDQQVGGHCKQIKRLAKELDIPILLLQQLNREADDMEPSLRHLRESGSIEQDADIVMFLHHGRSGRKGKAEVPHWQRSLIVAKFRAGPPGDMLIGWSGRRYTFGSISKAAIEAAEESVDPEVREAARKAAEDAAVQEQSKFF